MANIYPKTVFIILLPEIENFIYSKQSIYLYINRRDGTGGQPCHDLLGMRVDIDPLSSPFQVEL